MDNTVWVDASLTKKGTFIGFHKEKTNEQGWSKIEESKNSTEAEEQAVLLFLEFSMRRKKFNYKDVPKILCDNQEAVRRLKENILTHPFLQKFKKREEVTYILNAIDQLNWRSREGNKAHLVVAKKRGIQMSDERSLNTKEANANNQPNRKSFDVTISIKQLENKIECCLQETTGKETVHKIPSVKTEIKKITHAIMMFVKNYEEELTKKQHKIKRLFFEKGIEIKTIKAEIHNEIKKKIPQNSQLRRNLNKLVAEAKNEGETVVTKQTQPTTKKIKMFFAAQPLINGDVYLFSKIEGQPVRERKIDREKHQTEAIAEYMVETILELRRKSELKKEMMFYTEKEEVLSYLKVEKERLFSELKESDIVGLMRKIDVKKTRSQELKKVIKKRNKKIQQEKSEPIQSVHFE